MIDYDKITDIFCIVDGFCKDFDATTQPFLLGKPSKRPPTMSKSEIISICMLFHLSGFRCFKHFYIFYLQRHMQREFPNTVSYNRFVELSQSVLMPMSIFLKTCCLGLCTGISFVDSTPIRVCHTKRIKRNKVFKGIAEVGKSTMGWFYGFKLHIVLSDKGEILNFAITQANVDDREPLKNEAFLKAVFGKLFADKGYISEKLTKILFVGDIHLITNIRNNMKNSLMTMNDKIMLRKRSVIETVNDELKNICQIEHSRHRSFTNFIVNIVSGLIAYSFLPKKPSISYQQNRSNQILAF
ncbi:DDE family transposase [Mucilaginibacter gracilis]|uniref:DDE family transposase n=1 Tax=Mucilaginibacter gracilis TaxID=423350 RepID=A0A495J2I1_9SPHI|nr:IS982 family transposase [Mucilaginibacter gracilis]RKR82219.1 DDE family transposase [Mucilaginibacter gracilis]